MVGRLILRGLLCGLIAGLLTFGFARFFGEPLVDRAIAFEPAMDGGKDEAPEPEIVGRETQAGLGLLTGTVVVGTALGGLFALAFALLHGRLGRATARETAALLALAAFVVLAVVPMVKYPANPPSVGDPATIGLRTALYFELIAVSLAAAALSAALARPGSPAPQPIPRPARSIAATRRSSASGLDARSATSATPACGAAVSLSVNRSYVSQVCR